MKILTKIENMTISDLESYAFWRDLSFEIKNGNFYNSQALLEQVDKISTPEAILPNNAIILLNNAVGDLLSHILSFVNTGIDINEYNRQIQLAFRYFHLTQLNYIFILNLLAANKCGESLVPDFDYMFSYKESLNIFRALEIVDCLDDLFLQNFLYIHNEDYFNDLYRLVLDESNDEDNGLNLDASPLLLHFLRENPIQYEQEYKGLDLDGDLQIKPEQIIKFKEFCVEMTYFRDILIDVDPSERIEILIKKKDELFKKFNREKKLNDIEIFRLRNLCKIGLLEINRFKSLEEQNKENIKGNTRLLFASLVGLGIEGLNDLFHKNVLEGSCEKVSFILNAIDDLGNPLIDANSRNQNDQKAILVAAMNYDEQMVELLLKRGSRSRSAYNVLNNIGNQDLSCELIFYIFEILMLLLIAATLAYFLTPAAIAATAAASGAVPPVVIIALLVFITSIVVFLACTMCKMIIQKNQAKKAAKILEVETLKQAKIEINALFAADGFSIKGCRKIWDYLEVIDPDKFPFISEIRSVFLNVNSPANIGELKDRLSQIGDFNLATCLNLYKTQAGTALMRALTSLKRYIGDQPQSDIDFKNSLRAMLNNAIQDAGERSSADKLKIYNYLLNRLDNTLDTNIDELEYIFYDVVRVASHQRNLFRVRMFSSEIKASGFEHIKADIVGILINHLPKSKDFGEVMYGKAPLGVRSYKQLLDVADKLEECHYRGKLSD